MFPFVLAEARAKLIRIEERRERRQARIAAIKMTATPAGQTYHHQTIWNIVAFLKKLPNSCAFRVCPRKAHFLSTAATDIGQAPGRKVHETGIPWDDASGDRLRSWLGLTPEQFYDPRKIAIVPMGFCYPGKAPSGDNPPRPECAPRWHEKLNARLPNIALTLLIGQYAQASYLGGRRKPTLSDTVRAWSEYLPLGYMPLAHPSPRNQPWLARNPWFEKELVRELRSIVQALKL